MKRNPKHVKHTRAKKLLFSTLLILIPVIILFVLEMFLRLINYGDDYKLFLDFPGKDFQEYKYINPIIGKKYFQKLDYNKPCGDMFLKKKPENSFRIFVLGSSTVLGFPYNQNLMFSRILQERLQDCYPEKKIEVINTAITAINSFTFLDFVDEMLKEKPDAILIYEGHNEFYGAMGIGSVEKAFNSRGLTLLHLNLLSFRFYQLLRNSIYRIGELISGQKSHNNTRGTLMKVIVNNKDIPYKGDVYNRGIGIFEKNIDKILQKAKRKNVPVFISEVVSNVKDLKPFCSEKTSGFPLAVDIYNDAIKYEKEGNFKKAKEDYYYAKDLDCIRFRASEEINESIHKLALKYDAHLIPMKTIFEEASSHQLIGHNLITEHLHPNIAGYFLMADAFFNEISGSKLIGEKIDSVYYKSSSYYQKNWGYTELDSLQGEHLVQILSNYWPFQSIESTAAHFKETYIPYSLADSLAFSLVLSPALGIDEAHFMMADFFMKKGDYYRAFKEYYASIKYDPFQVSNYNNAAQCLMHTNDFNLALKLLNKSLELKETFNAYFAKSEILIIKGDYVESINALNKAWNLDLNHENIAIIMAKLYEAYFYLGNEKKLKETLAILKKISPDYQPHFSEKKIEYVHYIPVQVEGQVLKALDFYNSGRYDDALKELLISLEIKETSIANRTIADILAGRNDQKAILYYLKAYPDYKNDIGFLYDFGNTYLKFNNSVKAKEILEKMKRLDGNNQKTLILEKEIKFN